MKKHDAPTWPSDSGNYEPNFPQTAAACDTWTPLPAKQPTALEQSAYRGYRKVHVFLQPEEAAEVEAWLAAYEAEYPAIKEQA